MQLPTLSRIRSTLLPGTLLSRVLSTDCLRLLLVVLVVLGMWGFVLCVSQPTIMRDQQAGGYTFGPYYSDSYSSWMATYAVQQGRDPYSPAVTADIQRGVFGRVLTPHDPVKITNAFVYPLYIIFVLRAYPNNPFYGPSAKLGRGLIG